MNMNQEPKSPVRYIRREIGTPAIEGVLLDAENGLWLDRRYTAEAVETSTAMTPRTADLNIIGPDYVRISFEQVAELGYNRA